MTNINYHPFFGRLTVSGYTEFPSYRRRTINPRPRMKGYHKKIKDSVRFNQYRKKILPNKHNFAHRPPKSIWYWEI